MKYTAITLSILVLFGSCTSYKYSNKTGKEEVVMASLDYKEPITLQKVVAQNNPAEVSRGFVSSEMLIQGANLAIQGVKYLIDESKKKYVAEYTGGIHNENFYATNSKSGMLDPEGIQFKGFVFERKFADKKKETLDAVKIAVSLDESKMEDLYFNARFYLKLDSAVIDYAKVKLNDKKWYIPWTWFIKKQTTFNLDMEINILANWLDETGSIHSDVPFGKFILPLRNIPVDPNSDARKVYFEKLKNTPIAGSSYIIPRSVTYCTDKKGKSEPCFGRGNFNITVKVKESSKEGFVTKIIHENSDELLKNLNANDLKKIIR
jgi:hypothetical protein